MNLAPVHNALGNCGKPSRKLRSASAPATNKTGTLSKAKPRPVGPLPKWPLKRSLMSLEKFALK
jgi:hypothetical protein